MTMTELELEQAKNALLTMRVRKLETDLSQAHTTIRQLQQHPSNDHAEAQHICQKMGIHLNALLKRSRSSRLVQLRKLVAIELKKLGWSNQRIGDLLNLTRTNIHHLTRTKQPS